MEGAAKSYMFSGKTYFYRHNTKHWDFLVNKNKGKTAANAMTLTVNFNDDETANINHFKPGYKFEDYGVYVAPHPTKFSEKFPENRVACVGAGVALRFFFKMLFRAYISSPSPPELMSTRTLRPPFCPPPGVHYTDEIPQQLETIEEPKPVVHFDCYGFQSFLALVMNSILKTTMAKEFEDFIGEDLKSLGISKEELVEALKTFELICSEEELEGEPKPPNDPTSPEQPTKTVGFIRKLRILLVMRFIERPPTEKRPALNCFEIEHMLTQNEAAYFDCFDNPMKYQEEHQEPEVYHFLFMRPFRAYIHFLVYLFPKWKYSIVPLNIWEGLVYLIPKYMDLYLGIKGLQIKVLKYTGTGDGLWVSFAFNKYPWGIFIVEVVKGAPYYLQATIKTMLREFTIDISRFFMMVSTFELKNIQEMLGNYLIEHMQPIVAFIYSCLEYETTPELDALVADAEAKIILPPPLQVYLKTDLMSFPIALMLFDFTLTELSFVRLKLPEGVQIHNYFKEKLDYLYFPKTEQNPSLEGYFLNLNMKEVNSFTEWTDLNFEQMFSGLEWPSSFHVMFGHAESKRKVYFQFYGYDYEIIKAFHVKISSFNFDSEYLVLYSSIVEMRMIFYEIISQITAKLIALSVTNVEEYDAGVPKRAVPPEKIKQLIDSHVYQLPLCFKPNESYKFDPDKLEAGVIFTYYTLPREAEPAKEAETTEEGEKKQTKINIQKCEEKLDPRSRKAISLVIKPKQHDVQYSLKIHQPSAYVKPIKTEGKNYKSKVKPMISEFNFFVLNPYDHESVVESYIKLALKNYLQDYQWNDDKKAIDEVMAELGVKLKGKDPVEADTFQNRLGGFKSPF